MEIRESTEHLGEVEFILGSEELNAVPGFEGIAELTLWFDDKGYTEKYRATKRVPDDTAAVIEAPHFAPLLIDAALAVKDFSAKAKAQKEGPTE